MGISYGGIDCLAGEAKYKIEALMLFISFPLRERKNLTAKDTKDSQRDTKDLLLPD
jgi:hypothetical protein